MLAACVKQLNLHNILLEGCLLKPNMVTPGADCPTRASNEDIGYYTDDGFLAASSSIARKPFESCRALACTPARQAHLPEDLGGTLRAWQPRTMLRDRCAAPQVQGA